MCIAGEIDYILQALSCEHVRCKALPKCLAPDKIPPEPIEAATSIESKTPEEVLEDAYMEIRENLAQELLAMVKQSSSIF